MSFTVLEELKEDGQIPSKMMSVSPSTVSSLVVPITQILKTLSSLPSHSYQDKNQVPMLADNMLIQEERCTFTMCLNVYLLLMPMDCMKLTQLEAMMKTQI